MTTERATAALLAACICCCTLLVAAMPPARAQESFTDSNKTCTMKVTPQEEGVYLVGVICEQRKVLSYWTCREPQRSGFSPYECLEKETQFVDPVKGAQKQSHGREMRIYATDIERVPYVLCGRLCDPTR